MHDITVDFPSATGPIRALQNVDFEVGARDFVAILGPSGCGKSTLLRVASGLIPPTSGTVTVNGHDPQRARAARELGFVFQSPALLAWRTVLENVRLPLEVGPPAARRDWGTGPDEALELVGLTDFVQVYPHQLSGGMQQRTAIARALVMAADVLLMDEPFGALDEITRVRLNSELLSLWSRVRMSIVFVTHSIPEAAFLARRVVVMSARPGQVCDVVDVPFNYPRDPDLRDSPELSDTCQRLRHALDRGSASAE